MIGLFTGNNDYMIRAAVQARVSQFTGEIRRVDGSEIDASQLADLLAGGGLFSQAKLVIITELSKNKTIWPKFSDWLGRVSDDTELILVEPNPDKRTTAFKALNKTAEIKQFKRWTDREQAAAVTWTIDAAKQRDIKLDQASARRLVQKSLVPTGKPGKFEVDQWRIDFGLEKLRVVKQITPVVIDEIIEGESLENGFELLELSIRGRTDELIERLANLRAKEEPHMLFGLIVSQVYNLILLAHADKPAAEVARDAGLHPYAVEKLQPLASQLKKSGSRQLARQFFEADKVMKTTGRDVWATIEALLLSVASSR